MGAMGINSIKQIDYVILLCRDIPSGSASVQLAFCVAYDEVNICHAELAERDVEIVDPPRDQEFGHRTLFFRDPEGNVLEIYAEL